jgi:hypothetical protein
MIPRKKHDERLLDISKMNWKRSLDDIDELEEVARGDRATVNITRVKCN